jgi:hypothetical protein
MREPEPAMMRMVAALSLNFFHRVKARNHFARSGTEWVQIRLGGIRSKIKRGKRLATDFDIHAVVAFLDLDLRGKGQGEYQGEANISHRCEYITFGG